MFVEDFATASIKTAAFPYFLSLSLSAVEPHEQVVHLTPHTSMQNQKESDMSAVSSGLVTI